MQAIGEKQRFLHFTCDEDGRQSRFVEQRQVIFLHQLPGHHVEAAERLVKDHHLRRVDQRLCDLGAAHHAAGKLVRVFGLEIPQSEPVEQRGSLLLRLRPRHPFGERAEQNVVLDGHPRPKRRFLKHDQPVGPRLGDRLAIDR